MAPKRRGPDSDSLAANPRAALALDQLFSIDSFREGEKASVWYNDKVLEKIFATVDPENFAKGTRNCTTLNLVQTQICTQLNVVYFTLTLLFLLTQFSSESMHY